jgi:hypothetical protein
MESSQKPHLSIPAAAHFELRFQSLYHSGRALAFPCDARGEVPLGDLSPKALENYLFARAVIGDEYAAPEVLACGD